MFPKSDRMSTTKKTDRVIFFTCDELAGNAVVTLGHSDTGQMMPGQVGRSEQVIVECWNWRHSETGQLQIGQESDGQGTLQSRHFSQVGHTGAKWTGFVAKGKLLLWTCAKKSAKVKRNECIFIFVDTFVGQIKDRFFNKTLKFFSLCY